MKKHIANTMLVFLPISDRVIMKKLEGKPFNTNVMQVYVPTSVYTDEEVEEFYDPDKQ